MGSVEQTTLDFGVKPERRNKRILRAYQTAAVEAIERELTTSKSTLVVMATGLGKSVVLGELAARTAGNVLVLSHRNELVRQVREHLWDASGEWTAIEQGLLQAGEARLVSASVQTMVRRLKNFDQDWFELIVIDECFPAWTMIGDKKIEEIRVGDLVESFNHATGEVEKKKVVRLFTKKATAFVGINFGDGNDLVCTVNHPVYMRRDGKDKYVKAENIAAGDLCCMRTSVRARDGHVSETAEGMLSGMPAKVIIDDHGAHKSSVCIGTNAVKKSDEDRKRSRICEQNTETNRASSAVAGREWNWSDNSGSDATGRTGKRLDLESFGCDEDTKRKRISALLQDRCGKSEKSNSRRGRRIEPCGTNQTGAGQEERRLFTWCRVESVESIEYLCDGGLAVYNLEVEENSNYFANGYLVHNCHHAVASTYRKIIEHFGARIVGVTATPDRGDGTGLRGIFQTVAYEMGIVQGVEDGWLVPLKGQRRFIEGIHLEKIKKVAGDLALGALDNEIVNSKVAIARDLVARLQDKHAIVFTPGVESAKLVSAALNEIIPGCSREVDGNTNEDERRESFDLFKSGRIGYLVNCAIATEGVDLPVADVIAMCRPTLSRACYTQMVGRGLRSRSAELETLSLPEERRLAIARSCKPDCLILDYVGNSGKHDLIGPEDILGADESDAVRKTAKKIIKEKSNAGEQIDIQEAIRLAKKALAELADRRVEARVRSHGFDPLAAFLLKGRLRPDMDQRIEPPTAAQLGALLRFKLKESELKGLTKRSAGALMDKLIERSRLGLCSAGQMRVLIKFTDISQSDLANVSFPLASAMIDRIAKSNWKRGWTRDELYPKDNFIY